MLQFFINNFSPLVSSFEGTTFKRKQVKPPIVTPKPTSRDIVRRLSLSRTESDNHSMSSHQVTNENVTYTNKPAHDVIR